MREHNSFSIRMAFQSYSTGNKIQGAGAKSIGESMMTNTSITTLYMNRKHEKKQKYNPTHNVFHDHIIKRQQHRICWSNWIE